MFKFLDPTGCTYHNGEAFQYNLPQRGEKWAVTEHPEPAAHDGASCGPGRLHLMRKLDARYAPRNWWPWWAIGIDDEIGCDHEKAAFGVIKLRRISPQMLARCLRPPFNWGKGANLYGAYLSGAYLYGADLSRANLCGADLYGATWNEYTRWPDGFEPPK